MPLPPTDITNLPETVLVDGSDDREDDHDRDEEEGDENDRVARWVKEGLRDGDGAEEYKQFLLLFAECFSGGGSVAARNNALHQQLLEVDETSLEGWRCIHNLHGFQKKQGRSSIHE